jgi:Flp pilus assembly protein CpaB
MSHPKNEKNKNVRPCVSCGEPVLLNQIYPYPGHKKNCKLAEMWRAIATAAPEVTRGNK